VAVVGHVEWIEFARVEELPASGEIVHASEVWEQPGGGGAVAAGQLAKLAGSARLYTALGDDELGRRAAAELIELGLTVEATTRPEPQRRGFVHVDAAGERTITVIGDRLGPRGDDALPWRELADVDAVYLTAGDVGAVRAARAAGTLVASARGLETLAEAGVELDALVASARDRGERYEPGDLDPAPRFVIRTAGAAGGSWEGRDGSRGSWDATPLAGPISDAYGCGDSFAAGLTYGLGAGLSIDAALQLAARCGAACFTGRGPYAGQLTRRDL
jgi:ribokinase